MRMLPAISARNDPSQQIHPTARVQSPGNEVVSEQTHCPQHRQAVRHIRRGDQRSRGREPPRFPIPRQRERPETEPQAEIEIEQTHVEGPTVGEHRQNRQQGPGPRSGHLPDERERAPDENQHRAGDRDPLRHIRAVQFEQAFQDSSRTARSCSAGRSVSPAPGHPRPDAPAMRCRYGWRGRPPAAAIARSRESEWRQMRSRTSSGCARRR